MTDLRELARRVAGLPGVVAQPEVLEHYDGTEYLSVPIGAYAAIDVEPPYATLLVWDLTGGISEEREIGEGEDEEALVDLVRRGASW